MKSNRLLRLPIGDVNSFAPIALGDVAKVVANILVSKGQKGLGLSDRFRGQLITLTGPTYVLDLHGPPLSQALIIP